jgi:hypothetical protein
MADAHLAESHAAALFFAQGVGTGIALAFSAAGCTVVLEWYSGLGLHHDVSNHIFGVVVL